MHGRRRRDRWRSDRGEGWEEEAAPGRRGGGGGEGWQEAAAPLPVDPVAAGRTRRLPVDAARAERRQRLPVYEAAARAGRRRRLPVEAVAAPGGIWGRREGKGAGLGFSGGERRVERERRD